MAGIRVYADTSVYGGAFDEAFTEPSRAFFEQVRAGRFDLVISPIVQRELERAPDIVQGLLDDMQAFATVVEITEGALRLQKRYLEASIVGPKWRADALHVALASVSECRVIVSWNFKHIVNFQKIPLYNGVNLASGYGTVAIHSPLEVVAHEDENI